jgi:hypothetical protein
MMQAAPPAAPQTAAQPAPQDGSWVWNGTDWCWVFPSHPIWPTPPGPMPCPPFPPSQQCCPSPPSCFSELAKWNACWDQSQSLEQFLTKVITDIFTQNPDIIPSPPPSAGSGPIIGVTDGSSAAPGEVGEFLSQSESGSFVATAGGGSAVYAALTLTPGDWDVSSTVQLTNINNSFYYNGMEITISNAATVVGEYLWRGNFNVAAGGIIDGIFTTPTFRVSTSSPLLLTGMAEVLGVFVGTGTGTVDWSANTVARRRR